MSEAQQAIYFTSSLLTAITPPIVFVLDLEAALPSGFHLPEAQESEKESAAGLRPEAARFFLLRRQILRGLIATFTNMPPQRVSLVRAETGALTCQPAELRLHVSLSHRSQYAALGLAHQPFGVDLEPDRHTDPIPDALLHPMEREALEAIPSNQRIGAFLRLWSAKEAYVKASGKGFGIAPESFAITGFETQTPLLRHGTPFSSDGGMSAHLRLETLELADGTKLHIAAALLGLMGNS